MIVDAPHICETCAVVFYVTVDPPLAEVEYNGQVWGTLEWDISCPFCGERLMPYLGISEEEWAEDSGSSTQ